MLGSLYSYRLIRGAAWCPDGLASGWWYTLLSLMVTGGYPAAASLVSRPYGQAPLILPWLWIFPVSLLFVVVGHPGVQPCFLPSSCTRWISWASISWFVNWRALPSICVILWNEVKAFSLWLGNEWRLGGDSIIVLCNTRLCGFQVNVWMPNIKAPFFCWCFPT